MDQLIEGLPLTNIGASGIVVIVVLLVLTGRLIPRRTHEDLAHDRDEWRATSRLRDQEIAEKNEQLRHLAEVGHTVDAIMRAMPHTADGGDRQ